MYLTNRDNKIYMLCYIISAVFSSYFLAKYLRCNYQPMIRIGIFVFLVLQMKEIVKQNVKLKENIAIIIFSILLGTTIVLGYHIHIGEGFYGTVDQNYITPYTKDDLLAFVFICVGIYEIFFVLYTWLKVQKGKAKNIQIKKTVINRRSIVTISVLLFLLWIPYLCAYWPGIILGDSVNSILQALGKSPLVNNHPIFYTLFIKGCIRIGHIFTDGNTIGIAIYSILQMLYMAGCFGYMICWVGERGELEKKWMVILTIIYGCTPYIATYSVALWKDGIFSASVVMITLFLADFVLSKGNIIKNIKWLIKMLIFMLLAIFSRNNGIYIIACIFLFMCGMLFLMKDKKEKMSYKKMMLCIIAVLIFSKIVTGPIYDKMGWNYKKSASHGIFIAQMARVVACDGNMNEEETDYMARLFPLEKYKEVYCPCIVDPLKWHEEFDAKVLNKDFFKYWFSMLVKNPRLYFEAWEMQTYGFWTINCPNIMRGDWNISAGVPRNINETYRKQLESFGIKTDNLFKTEKAREIFVLDEWSVPIGVTFFLLLFLMIVLTINNCWRFLLVLVPSMGVFLTLVIASPISYWPRYGLVLQLLIPVYLIFFLETRK